MNISPRSPKTVRLRYKNPRYDRVVRVNTENIARSMGFDEDQVFDITLAVEEAYANAIEHASRHGPDLELEIIYFLLEDRIEISVHDTGCGFLAPQDDGTPPRFRGIESSRGRGIALIRMLSDAADILSEPGIGTLIRITKFLVKPKARPGAAPAKKKAASPKKKRSPGVAGKRSSRSSNLLGTAGH
ncbi:MAG TPA: ATP-binding protein [Candidatus Ozemobacteraceae bacterium]|nr:ATP-binding protein [Candidatus Ozemobacteraceae bacterium]